jgi:phosphomannomutase
MKNSIVKANDIRGKFGAEWNDSDVYAIAKGFANFLKAKGEQKTLIGRDTRHFGKQIKNIFIQALSTENIEVIDIDLCSTDQMNLASGLYSLPAIMVTASHNPKEYNGLKFMVAGAKPIGITSGLNDIIDFAKQYILNNKTKKDNINKKAQQSNKKSDKVQKLDTLEIYEVHLNALVDLTNVRPIKIVIDASNAMAGLIAPAIFSKYPQIKIIPLFFELDGDFPNHPPNPLDKNNLRDLQKTVIKEKADLGLAFDGDADRCFVVDENGKIINPSVIICAISEYKIKNYLKTHTDKPVVIHNLITSKVVNEVVTLAGGTAIETRVGHSFIKKEMRERNALFGGEHSAHYYFNEFYYADSGMLASLNTISLLNELELKPSELTKKYLKYFQSQEINTSVKNPQKTIDKIKSIYQKTHKISLLDGITISNWDKKDKWWANIRGSNTEPLLRLNVEANTQELLNKITNEILENIKK